MGRRATKKSPTDDRKSPDGVKEEVSEKDSNPITEEESREETPGPSTSGGASSDFTESTRKRKAREALKERENKIMRACEEMDLSPDKYDYLEWVTVMNLWHEYERRKKNLTNEEKQLFKSIFCLYEEQDCSIEIPFADEEDYANLKAILENAVLNGTGLPKNSEPPKKPRKNANTPRLYLTYTNLDFLKNIPLGAMIVETAKRWKDNGSNLVYSHNIVVGPKAVGGIHFKSQYFVKKGFPKAAPGVRGHILPVVVIDVSNGFDEQTLKNQVTNTTCCIIRGLDKAVGMDLTKFDINTITSIMPDHIVNTSRNRAQPARTNYTMSSDGKSNRKNPIVDTVSEKDYKLRQYTENYSDLLEILRKAFDDVLANSSNHHEILRKFQKDLKENQLPIIFTAVDKERRIHGSVIVSSFATNFDLTDEKFPEQMAEIKKLPLFFRPGEGMFKYCLIDVPGCNKPQMYFKTPGCRTSGHLENQVAASINLNLGSGECVWYCVPMIHIAKMQALFNKKGVSPTGDYWWINEDDLKEFGIPYQKIIQKAGDMIYVGIGTYHWVQSNGYCANVSWNVAQMDPLQLLATALITDFNREQRYAPIVPFMPMLWEMADQKVLPGTEFSRIVKQLLISCLAKAQFDLSSVTIRNMESLLIEGTKYNLQSIVKCQNTKEPNCAQSYLLNLVAIVDKEQDVKEFLKKQEEARERLEEEPSSEQGVVMCIECAQKHKSEENRITLQQMYSMEDLIKIFDEYN